MKKFIIYLFSIFLIIQIADKIISYSLDKIISKSNFRLVNLFSESPDIYLIGNSRGVNSLVEKTFENIFPIDILNLSYNGLTPNEILLILEHIDKKKTVIIEISNLLSNDRYNDLSTRFNSIKRLRKENWKGRFFNLIYFNSELTFRLFYYLFNSDKEWINKGILSNDKLTYLSKNIKKEKYNLKNFNLIKKRLDNLKINYLFFLAPIHKEKRRGIENFHEINSLIKNILKNKYLDLSDKINLNSGFSDLIHTNENSLQVIHNELFSFINENIKQN